MSSSRAEWALVRIRTILLQKRTSDDVLVDAWDRLREISQVAWPDVIRPAIYDPHHYPEERPGTACTCPISRWSARFGDHAHECPSYRVPDDIVERVWSYQPMTMCEHANEAPRGECDCPSNCGCREPGVMCATR